MTNRAELARLIPAYSRRAREERSAVDAKVPSTPLGQPARRANSNSLQFTPIRAALPAATMEVAVRQRVGSFRLIRAYCGSFVAHDKGATRTVLPVDAWSAGQRAARVAPPPTRGLGPLTTDCNHAVHP